MLRRSRVVPTATARSLSRRRWSRWARRSASCRRCRRSRACPWRRSARSRAACQGKRPRARRRRYCRRERSCSRKALAASSEVRSRGPAVPKLVSPFGVVVADDVAHDREDLAVALMTTAVVSLRPVVDDDAVTVEGRVVAGRRVAERATTRLARSRPTAMTQRGACTARHGLRRAPSPGARGPVNRKAWFRAETAPSPRRARSTRRARCSGRRSGTWHRSAATARAIPRRGGRGPARPHGAPPPG